MKEYKVKKITKYEALDKVNREIATEAVALTLSLAALFIFMGLSSINIVYLFLSLPLACIEGKILDSIETLIKTKKRYLKDEFQNIETINSKIRYKIIDNKGLKK